MAFSKKQKRKITVGEDIFYWISDFQSDILRLTIMTEEKSNSRLTCAFDYKNFWLYFKDILEGKDIKIQTWNLTPKIVRQVIDLAITEGWKPFEKGKDFILKNIEHKIDINFWTESTSETRQSEIQNLKSKIV